MSGQADESDHVTLVEDERLAISAVVHQGYYMPDVFATVEHIIAERLALSNVEARHAELSQVQESASRAVHVHSDLNRRERADALFLILGEAEASFERVARFMRWADAYQERAVEIATEVAYLELRTPPG